MCVYSMIVQDRIDKWKKDWYEFPFDPNPAYYPNDNELEDLKKEVKELRRLLEKALKYDKDTNQKDCESEDKKKLLKDMAQKLGVEIEFPDEEE